MNDVEKLNKLVEKLEILASHGSGAGLTFNEIRVLLREREMLKGQNKALLDALNTHAHFCQCDGEEMAYRETLEELAKRVADPDCKGSVMLDAALRDAFVALGWCEPMSLDTFRTLKEAGRL